LVTEVGRVIGTQVLEVPLSDSIHYISYSTPKTS